MLTYHLRYYLNLIHSLDYLRKKVKPPQETTSYGLSIKDFGYIYAESVIHLNRASSIWVRAISH